MDQATQMCYEILLDIRKILKSGSDKNKEQEDKTGVSHEEMIKEACNSTEEVNRIPCDGLEPDFRRIRLCNDRDDLDKVREEICLEIDKLIADRKEEQKQKERKFGFRFLFEELITLRRVLHPNNKDNFLENWNLYVKEFGSPEPQILNLSLFDLEYFSINDDLPSQRTINENYPNLSEENQALIGLSVDSAIKKLRDFSNQKKINEDEEKRRSREDEMKWLRKTILDLRNHMILTPEEPIAGQYIYEEIDLSRLNNLELDHLLNTGDFPDHVFYSEN